jgi:hypothetical protein
MKIAALLCVKDEVELIERAIAHLRAIGVDHITVCDMKSTDGTLDILSRHQSESFRLIEVDDSEAMSGDEWSRLEMELVRSVDADWFIFLDGDEFWIPASGTLKRCAALQSADVLSVARFNVTLGPAGPLLPETLRPEDYDRLLLFVEPIPDFRVHMQEHPETAWIRGVPMPKVMARPERIGSLTLGQHDVVSDLPIRKVVPDDLLIAHVPFSTAGRFGRKVENVRRTLQVHDTFYTGLVGWHWRRWLALDDRGIAEEFSRQAFDDARVSELRQSGTIRSAAEVFLDRMASTRDRAEQR